MIVTISNLAYNVSVPAIASNGVAVGIVSNRVTYTYSASGLCDSGDLGCNNNPCSGGCYDPCYPCTNAVCGANPSGIFSETGLPVDCPSVTLDNMERSVCPYLQCFSLVGRIE